MNINGHQKLIQSKGIYDTYTRSLLPYNKLLQMEYSPIAALNRTFALSKVSGRNQAILEAETLQLTDNHYYYTLLGELYKEENTAKAKEHFLKALSLAKKIPTRKLLQGKFHNFDCSHYLFHIGLEIPFRS
jgi:predicted RNA polymerase sigma factor